MTATREDKPPRPAAAARPRGLSVSLDDPVAVAVLIPEREHRRHGEEGRDGEVHRSVLGLQDVAQLGECVRLPGPAVLAAQEAAVGGSGRSRLGPESLGDRMGASINCSRCIDVPAAAAAAY